MEENKEESIDNTPDTENKNETNQNSPPELLNKMSTNTKIDLTESILQIGQSFDNLKVLVDDVYNTMNQYTKKTRHEFLESNEQLSEINSKIKKLF